MAVGHVRNLISSRSTWVFGFICCFLNFFTFFRPPSEVRRRPVLVPGVHANFLTHVSLAAKAASTALTCEDCGVRFISRLKYKIQAWRHVYDSLCIRLPLALVEAVLKKLACGKSGVAAHHAISDGIVCGIWRAVRNRHCPLLLTYYSLFKFCVVSRAMRSALFAPV